MKQDLDGVNVNRWNPRNRNDNLSVRVVLSRKFPDVLNVPKIMAFFQLNIMLVTPQILTNLWNVSTIFLYDSTSL